MREWKEPGLSGSQLGRDPGFQSAIEDGSTRGGVAESKLGTPVTVNLELSISLGHHQAQRIDSVDVSLARSLGGRRQRLQWARKVN